MMQTYHGSCHCGAVRFECRIDLAPPGRRSPQGHTGIWYEASFRCNCTFCRKTRFWKGFVPASDFRLTAGEDRLTDYRHGTRMIRNRFCSVCGVHPFAEASLEEMGGAFYAVNLATLDDVSPEEMAGVPIRYEDGVNDAWTETPTVTSYL